MFYLTEEETSELKKWKCNLSGYSLLRPMKNKPVSVDQALYCFSLKPSPPELKKFTDYIDICVREKDLTYFWFFLHFYERILNEAVEHEILNDGRIAYSPENIYDMKAVYRDFLLKKLLTFDPDFGVQFTSYFEKGKRDPAISFLYLQEDWSSTSLSEYKTERSICQNYSESEKGYADAVNRYMLDHGCSYEKAVSKIAAPQAKRRRVKLYRKEKDEMEPGDKFADTTHEYNSDYTEKIYRHRLCSVVEKAMEVLSDDEREIIFSRLAVCPECYDVKEESKARSLENLAVDFACSRETISDIYYNGLEKMKKELLKSGVVFGAKVFRKPNERSTKKATYFYLPVTSDEDDKPGEIVLDFIKKSAEVITPADRDFYKTNLYAQNVIRYIFSLSSASLPKKMLVLFENENY